MATSYKELIEAKKENVGLQLEIEYRSRLNEAYKQVRLIRKDWVSGVTHGITTDKINERL